MEDATKIKIVTVESFSDIMLANIMKTKLEAYGIECFLADENIVTINPLYTQAVGGIKLKVREEDLEKAKEVIKESTIAEDNTADEGPSCPYCGSANTIVALGHANVFAAMWSLFLSSLPFNSKQSYYCQTCKKHFKKKMKSA